MIHSHQAEIGVTQMTAFLSCKPEAEHSATGPEREERGVGKGGQERRRMWAFQRVSAWMPLLHNSSPREETSGGSGTWGHCSDVRDRKKSREVRFS